MWPFSRKVKGAPEKRAFYGQTTSTGQPARWLLDALNVTNASGQNVSATTVEAIAAAYACTQVIAESIGSLPFNVYRREADGNRTLVRDHPLMELLRIAPNA